MTQNRDPFPGKKIVGIKRAPPPEMSFGERVRKFEEYAKDPKQSGKIFTELGFSFCDDDDAEGYCGCCERNGSCPEHPKDTGLYLNGRLKRHPASQIRIRVDSISLSDAFEDQRGGGIESHYFLDTETGEVIHLTSDAMQDAESDENTSDLKDWQVEELRLARKILTADDDRYRSV